MTTNTKQTLTMVVVGGSILGLTLYYTSCKSGAHPNEAKSWNVPTPPKGYISPAVRAVCLQESNSYLGHFDEMVFFRYGSNTAEGFDAITGNLKQYSSLEVFTNTYIKHIPNTNTTIQFVPQ